MSTSSNGYIRVKERIPYAGKGHDELVMTLRKILGEPSNKYTQKIVLEVGVPHIYIEKLVPDKDELGAVPQQPIYELIRVQRMEEYDPPERGTHDEALTPMRQLFDMFNIVNQEGHEIGFIVAGNKYEFQKWLKVRIPNTPNMRVMGIPFVVSTDIPSDAFLICGTHKRDADPEDIAFSLKGSF